MEATPLCTMKRSKYITEIQGTTVRVFSAVIPEHTTTIRHWTQPTQLPATGTQNRAWEQLVIMPPPLWGGWRGIDLLLYVNLSFLVFVCNSKFVSTVTPELWMLEMWNFLLKFVGMDVLTHIHCKPHEYFYFRGILICHLTVCPSVRLYPNVCVTYNSWTINAKAVKLFMNTCWHVNFHKSVFWAYSLLTDIFIAPD